MAGDATLQATNATELSSDEIVRQSFGLALKAHDSGDLAQADQLYRAILSVRPNHADALHGLGVLSHQFRQHESAAHLIGLALAQRGDPVFHNNLALVLLELGRPHEAMNEVFKALQARPNYPLAYNALGTIQDHLGLKEEAIASYRRAIAMKPDCVDALCNLGKVLRSRGQGEFAEAKRCCEQALALDPQCVEAANNLGILLREMRETDEALVWLTKALDMKPNYAEAYVNRGHVFLLRNELQRAEADFRCALALKPGFAHAHCGLGVVCFKTRRLAESLDHYDKALALDERNPDALNGAGLAHYRLQHYDRAREYFDRAMSHAEPAARAELHYRFGSEMALNEKHDEAIECFERALEIDADHCDALHDRAHVLLRKGQAREAFKGFDEVLQRDERHLSAFANRLMTMHYLEDVSNADLLVAARRFGALHHRPMSDAGARRARVLDANRRLRIGYVSGDFNAHPVAIFLLRVLSSHNKAEVEVFSYYNDDRLDDYTVDIKTCSDHWREIKGVGDQDVATMIADDQIDILVDLTGHTAKGRMSLLGRKPAPLQVEWLGYFGTTGVPSIDYVVLDPISAPAGEDKNFSEKIVRLPYGRLCYSPPPWDVPFGEPPCLRTGAVTFGSFNNVAKLSETVIALWSRLLDAVPNSRLILKWKTFSSAGARDDLRASFARHGVGDARLDLREASIHGLALQQYNDVDIALDPFPFGGGTTSAEALWMGVPVITLPGERLASRQTLTFLHFMGYEELAATSHEDYIARAVALANDPRRLRELRPKLRQALLAAPFVDGSKFTATLEKAYREMWRRHCAGEKPAAFDIAE